VAQPIWQSYTPLFNYSGTLNMTQSSVVTERGGDINLVNAGGAINVGLKEITGTTSAPKGVIALGGGNIFGYAKDDFQVNTQRVFVVGKGNMNIWSSAGDIDSGRGANTAVAAPPLAARRSADGVVFETPATTTGSGLGILEDANGQRSGSIGLFPAFGEILALDAFIRAPSVVLGSSIKGGDNLIAGSVGGAAAPVAPPALAITPPSKVDEKKPDAAATGGQTAEQRQRNSLLTVELLGLGSAPEDDNCDEKERKDGKCPVKPPKK
jgi:filamentous hemagglutinin